MKKKFVPSFQSQILAAFSILLVLDGLYITDQLIAFFVPIRYVIFLSLLIGLFLYALSILTAGSLRKNQVYAVAFHLFLLSYGLFLSLVNGGFSLLSLRDLLFAFLAVFLTLVVMLETNRNAHYINSFSSDSKEVDDKRRRLNFNSFFVILLLISPFLLYALDIIQIFPIPQMIFETTKDGYLQETGRFFGLGAILFWYCASFEENRIALAFYVVFAFLMLALCGLAGARGEFLVCLLILILITVSFLNRKRTLLLAQFFLSILSCVAIVFAEEIGDLMVIRRIGELGSDNMGLRGQLLLQSLEVLGDRADCALIGCGFNYFQVHFGFASGLYPHNVFAELLITFGIPMGGSMVFLVLSGLAFGFLGSAKRTPLFWIFLYFLGINLKSGSLIGTTSIPVLIFFAYLGVLAIGSLVPQAEITKSRRES